MTRCSGRSRAATRGPRRRRSRCGRRTSDRRCRLIERLIDSYPSLPGPRLTDSTLADLTAREIDVLRLVASGYSNGEIAADLVVSEATVKTRVNRLLRKLELTTRVQLIVAAYECGPIRRGATSPRG
ncbi:response regulator transcription factor [Microlunatus phosphovorus]|uniref:response regulator transcription factor n=1 Tax=Microlunatus phosphovorus TaxID=29405 RepID=UPI000A062510|nr:LuxR C-terminal-related transcriptional regulator [Microlunatus phosphovorus]